MIGIRVLDEEHGIVIGGATILDYNKRDDPLVIGATNSSGLFETDRATLKDMRILANGYSFVDHVPPGTIKTGLCVPLRRIHPGAYTGYLPNAFKTTWESRENNLVFQFHSTGYCKCAKTIKDVRGQALRKYELEESDMWSVLKTGTTEFPNTKPLTVVLNSYNHLRFPEPGKMIARRANQNKEINFVRVN